jgi:hypothetical protein
MKTLIVAAACGAALLAGPAFAAVPQQAPGHGGMMAMMFPDPDGDGVTTKAEILAAADTRFDALDTNKDGKLDAGERAAAAGMGGRMLERADANGDGVVTRDEFHAQVLQRFGRVDTNGDGKIDQAEKDAVMQRMQQMRGGQ